MGEWSWIVNVVFAGFMVLATGFATLFANTVKSGFARSETDIKALYEKREADLAQFHAARIADMERILREFYEHKVDDAKALAECATRDGMNGLRNDTSNQIHVLRGEFSAWITTLRDDMRHGLTEIKDEIAMRRRITDKANT